MPFVGITTLVGGSVFWLRRVGWLQPETFWIGNPELVRSSGHPQFSQETYEFVIRHHASLHQLDGWLVLTKYAREAVLAAFLLLVLTQVPRFRPQVRDGAAWLILFLLAVASAAGALLAGKWLALAAGARSFSAWFVGALAPPLADEELRRRLARVCVWTLLAQMVLAGIESVRGLLIYHIHMFDRDLVRVVGTFNLPASLGTFAVIAWALAWCWSGYSKRVLLGLTFLLILLLVVNGSATAWVALFAVLLGAAYSRLNQRWRPMLLAVLLPVALIGWQALPALTGRWDVHDSLWGRIAPITHYAEDHLSTRQVLFGTGFGLGTNGLGGREAQDVSGRMPNRPVGDSTPAVLFWQVGILGMLCAYLLLAVAIVRDSTSRAVGIALLVSSVALNITELFPVNLIMGFWLAHATFGKGDDGPA